MENLASPRKARGGKRSHKGRQSAHHAHTGKYARQHLRTERNKALARKQHLENHPNDLQARRTLCPR
jgi:hypothetical protein